MKNILFICTGNSIRSQIAEGFARTLSKGKHYIRSAGIAPSGVNKFAVESMNEIGIDISGQDCTLLGRSMLDDADYVVTLCDEAREKCQPLPRGTKYRHWKLSDPLSGAETERERRNNLSAVRDEIEKRVKELLEEIDNE